MLDDACIVMLSDAKKEERRHGKMLVQDPESGKKPTPDPGSRWMGQKGSDQDHNMATQY